MAGTLLKPPEPVDLTLAAGVCCASTINTNGTLIWYCYV